MLESSRDHNGQVSLMSDAAIDVAGRSHLI